ncbi:MAG: U32 family peptidase [Ruminococcaceae bacterium]|nr:U32 family peptidase [Oscillospiraceae bacterium]
MELLAPAGSFEALVAAVQSGADAVYIGGSQFSARRNANNFSIDEITKAADYCHIRNVKLHVAANILIKEKEVQSFLEYIGKLYRVVDAVIIQDIGMASKIRELYPDLPLHASTQMTVSSVAAAKKLEEMGFERIVLARELSMKQIECICKSVNAEIEVFAHGAICMCYSGQCLMSSIIGGRSGNRGMCAQPCRLPYSLDEEKGYLLSPKDLCMLEHLADLEKIGVDSIKIEGRLKRKEYVSAVCGIYRKYLDNPRVVQKSDIDELLDAFNRSGFTDGYFTEKLGRNMMTYKNPANVSENKFSDWVKQHSNVNCNLRKSGIYIAASLKKNEPLRLSCWEESGNYFEISGEISSQIAENKPLSVDRLKEQLEKLGQTPFYSLGVEIDIDEGITLPISEVNNVRRKLSDGMAEAKCFRREEIATDYIPSPIDRKTDIPKLVCQVSTYQQAKTAIENGIVEIYADTPLANRLYKEFENVKIIAKLPPIHRDDRRYEKPETQAVLISNIGQYDDKKECYGDFRLNITNSESVVFYNNLKRVTVSPELNINELSPISKGCEVIVYGRLPLMAVENCPLKALGKCQNHECKHYLKDRMDEEFPVKCNEGCVAEILNSKPIYMADKPEIVNKLKINALRLIFTVENTEKCGTIITEYKKMLENLPGKVGTENTFTRGHFYRGVD